MGDPPKKKTKFCCLFPPCEYNGQFLVKHLAKSHICAQYYSSVYSLQSKERETNLKKQRESDKYTYNNVEQKEIESIVTNVNDSNINNKNIVESFNYSITNRNSIIPLFTASHFVETGILKLLNDAQAPHELYNKILSWSMKAHLLGYSFQPHRFHRRSQLKYLENFEGLNIIRPYQISVKLDYSPSIVVPVSVYDFTKQLISLLSDESLFGNLSNLDVNADDCFGNYKSKNDMLNCVNSGNWYANA